MRESFVFERDQGIDLGGLTRWNVTDRNAAPYRGDIRVGASMSGRAPATRAVMRGAFEVSGASFSDEMRRRRRLDYFQPWSRSRVAL